jgi:hypothetical protein
MEYYDNPRYAENYRLKPWFILTDEERSHVVHRAYQTRVLTSEEVKPYLRQVRISNITQLIFPLLAFPIFKRTIFKLATARLYFTTNAAASRFTQAAIVGASWVAWINYNPFYTSLLQQKEDLLKVCEERIGFNLLDLNDVLPRWLTTFEIHRRMQALYNERNGPFAGYLYPNEESAEPLVDISSWPRKTRAKIVK